jgi:hypothetical protein
MADQIVSWGGFNSKGTSGMGVTGSFQVSSSANSFFVGGGSVGVGTTSPSKKLDVVGTAADGIIRVAGPYSEIQLINKNSPFNTGDWKPSIYFLENGVFQSSISYNGGFEFGGTITVTGSIINTGNASFGVNNSDVTVDIGGRSQLITFTDYNYGLIRGGINLPYVASPSGYGMNIYVNSGAMTFSTGGSTRLSIAQAGGVTVSGSGTTSSTTSFLVQNSAGSTALQVKDDKTTTFGAPIYLSGNQGYIYYGANDYIQFPRQGGPAPGYFSTSTAGDGWAFRLGSNNQTYARIMEGSFYLEAYTPDSNGRNNIRTWFSGSNFVYIDGDGVTGRSPAYGNGVNVVIRGGKSGTYENIDNRGAAGYVTVEGGSAFSGSSTTHITGAGVNIQTGLGLGTGSAADLTFSTSATSSVASVYHTLPQRMIIKGQTGFVGIGTSTPSASLHVSGAFLGYPVTVPTASGTASLDCNLGNFFNLTLSSSYTLFLSASNIQPGQTINLRVTQPATSGSLNYGSQFKFAGGIPYSASATGSAVDIISFITFDTTNLYGSAIKNLS